MIRQIIRRKLLLVCIILSLGAISASCTSRGDNKPPSAPLLTVTEVTPSSVSLAWSESYDNIAVDYYRIYRDGDALSEVSKTEYVDKKVEQGKQYEYYIVAYDEAGNRSSKSVKQNVTVEQDEEQPVGTSKSSDTDLKRVSKSTVRVYMLDDDFNIIGTGSGTIMNSDGHILTNYHVIGTEYGLNNSEGVVAIALTDDVRVSSQPQYFAQFRNGVQSLDLAVVQIVADLNGNEIDARDLRLTPAKVSDSDKIEIGEGINILGYPSVGGETITFTAGRVAGFIDENNDNEIDWIKTDAVVNHGNSGGTAINDNGEMIGVPTAKQVGADNDVMFYLKPVNQALPIIKDAIGNPALPEPEATPQPVPDQEAQEIDVYGRIIDAYTNQPVNGAAIIVLNPGVTCEQFTNDPQNSMMLTYDETNAEGFFYLPYVPVGNAYSVIIASDNYIPIMEDGVLEIYTYDASGFDIGDITLEPDK